MAIEGFLLCSQEAATTPYPGPDKSNPNTDSISPRSIIMLSSHLWLGLPSRISLRPHNQNFVCIKDKIFWTAWNQTFSKFNLLLISLWKKFWFVTINPKYFNFATFLKDLLAVFIFILWLCSAIWQQDMNICLVFTTLK
jgi:hypothetical protein